MNSGVRRLVVGAVVFVVILAALFSPLISVTTTIPSQSTSIFHLSDQTIQSSTFLQASAVLSAGENVSASWSASNEVAVYIFNSTQYSIYSRSGDGNSSMASETTKLAGTIGFRVPASGTYYLVLYDEDVGVYGAGNLYDSIYLYSAGGTATIPPSTTSCHESLATMLSGGHC